MWMRARLARRVGTCGRRRHPPGPARPGCPTTTQPERNRIEVAAMPPVFEHLDPIAAEVELAREVERRVRGDGDVRRLQRFVAPHRLVAGEAAAHDQPPVRPLAHQAQLRRQRDARAVRADRGDVEAASVPASTALSANAGLMPIRRPAGRTGISVAGQRGVAGRVVDPDGDRRLQRCVVSGAAASAIGSVVWPCASVSGSVRSLAVRRVGLVVQADAIAGQRRERRRDRSPAASAPGRSGRRPARRTGSAR